MQKKAEGNKGACDACTSSRRLAPSATAPTDTSPSHTHTLASAQRQYTLPLPLLAMQRGPEWPHAGQLSAANTASNAAFCCWRRVGA